MTDAPNQSLREKLQSELQEVEWSAIRPHMARDTVILISEELDLIDAAERVAKDDKVQVSKWIEAGLVNKPSAQQLQTWEGQLDMRFRFLILTPYVLIQKLAQ